LHRRRTPSPDSLWSWVGSPNLHAAFREENRTSLLSAGVALKGNRVAKQIHVVFLQRKPHLAIFVRHGKLRNRLGAALRITSPCYALVRGKML
jgi:hypothetical protein